MSRMQERSNAALLVRAEEAAELARSHARAKRPGLAAQAMAESVRLLEQAGVNVAQWAAADRQAAQP